ncbi:MAG: glutamine-hydrolyzing GMP synthase [Anaerolineae bacterium]|nr:glutamine-hydrolyzing GMP synthase [Anaerolineae bacterium]
MPEHQETIVILDYGSQYTQLIARRVRELNVYCQVLPWDAPASEALALDPRGYILSGGPNSVYDPGAPSLHPHVTGSGVPILGLCYGMQLLAHSLGGVVVPSGRREYGAAQATVVDAASPLFAGLPPVLEVWMSHGDHVERIPPGFHPLAESDNTPVAAMGDDARRWYGIQFHPEVQHTPRGMEILRRFLYDVCGCTGAWTTGHFIEQATARICAQVGDGLVVCGLSGGVDSAVAATLVHRAVGDQLTCVFVNNGLMRSGEPAQVVETFQRALGMRLIAVDATEEFLSALQGVIDPEQKRRVIGERFVRIFEREAARIAARAGRDVRRFLAQGTIYPDVIESAGRPDAHRIKSHHNVGGLPEDMDFELVEPLRDLFKDEVRRVGEALGLSHDMVWRHPFPGPGLGVRVLGEITWERLEILRAADAIWIDELRAAGQYHNVAQAFAVLLAVRSVGVMGDGRTYQQVVALRAVTTGDFMTASWAALPHDLLGRASSRIVNEVEGVNRVVYDISSKPPATIEWE